MYIIRNSFILLFILIFGFLTFALPLPLRFIALTLLIVLLFELFNLYYRKIILTSCVLIIVGKFISYVFLFKPSGDYSTPEAYIALILACLMALIISFLVTRKWDGLLWYIKGSKLFKKEKYSKSIEFFDKALASGTDEHSVLLAKGAALSYFTRYDEALQCFDDALNFKGNNYWSNDNPIIASLWSNKGSTLTSLGRYEEAMDCYDTSYKYYKHPFVFVYKGITFFEMGMKKPLNAWM